MEAYHIDRFGSVDGIVLRSSEDPRSGPKEILTRGGEFAQIPRSDGPERWDKPLLKGSEPKDRMFYLYGVQPSDTDAARVRQHAA
jgi:hypothetical protein